MTLNHEDSPDVEYSALDGNAAAGFLSELFAIDLTVAHLVCTGCSNTHRLAALKLYGLPMGAILRCPSCNNCVLRVVARAPDYWLDMRGASSLRVTRE